MQHSNLPEHLIGSLLQLLDKSITEMGELKKLLNKEQAALENIDIEAINECSSDKAENLEILEKIYTEAISIVRDLGYEPDAEGLKKCLSQLSDQDKRFEGFQQELMHTGIQCQELNRKNGQVLDAYARQTSEIISIISNSSNKTQLLYDSKGNPTAV